MRKLGTSNRGTAPLTLVAFLVIMVAAVIFAAYLWQTAVIKVATAIQIQHVTFTPSELRISAWVMGLHIDS